MCLQSSIALARDADCALYVAKRRCHVAALAKRPEGAGVDVLGPMAAHARRSQLYGFSYDDPVTGETVQSLVRSVQGVVRTFVMIEIPPAPVLGIVALLTTRPQPPLVHVIFLMARPAFFAGILEGSTFMTFLAWHGHMLAQERKPAQAVIKEDRPFPRLLVVATPAFSAFLAFVDVVFFMTAEASRLEMFLIENALMTSRASCLCVSTAQRKFRMTVVVEGDAPPVLRCVAAVTFGTEAPPVAFLVVVTLMTRVAGCFQFFLIERPRMTGRAFGEAVLSG